MSDPSNVARNLRERLSGGTEDRLGRALSDLLENPLLTGAIGRAFDAREKAAQAQEVAMGALNIPSAADIERLTRRLRAVSHRLEGIEDGVHRLDRALAPSTVEARLAAIEKQLGTLTAKLDAQAKQPAASARRSAGKSKAKKR
jgi:anti-sigma-K factor RskA